MFHLKVLLLITIAFEGCVAQLFYQVPLLAGECDKFNEEINNYQSWNWNRANSQNAIEQYYKGDLDMAIRITECLGKYNWGTPFQNYEDKMKSYVAMNQALKAHSQLNSYASLRLAMNMSELNTKMRTIFKPPQRDILGHYTTIFKKNTLASIKGICFDDWVKIVNPDSSKHMKLGVEVWDQLQFWPINTLTNWDSMESFKWWVKDRKFSLRKLEYDEIVPEIEVTFTNIEHNVMLVSNEEGKVWIAPDLSGEFRYNRWIAEFWAEDDKKKEINAGTEVGIFRLRNAHNRRVLRMLEPYTHYNHDHVKIADATTHEYRASYFVLW